MIREFSGENDMETDSEISEPVQAVIDTRQADKNDLDLETVIPFQDLFHCQELHNDNARLEKSENKLSGKKRKREDTDTVPESLSKDEAKLGLAKKRSYVKRTHGFEKFI